MSRNGATISWASYDLPTVINQTGGNSSSFAYGADRQRYQQVNVNGGATETTIYVGGLFEKLTKGATTEYKHYLFAAGERVAIHTRRSPGTTDTVYLLADHLGSVDKLTNSAGSIIVSLSYDAFGQRRGSSWTGSPSSGDWTAINANTHRGYTDHEQLDNLTLIHMNGRVYDPVIGRFLSADPLVQAPYNGQSLNRYSYVFNNPLSFTDPSGLRSALDRDCQDMCRLNWMLDLQRVVLELSPERTIAGDGAHGNDSRATPGAGGPDPMSPARIGVGGLGSVTPGLAAEGPRLSTVGGFGGALGYQRALAARRAAMLDAFGEQLDSVQSYLDYASIALDLSVVGGSISWIPDIANTSISAIRGDYLATGLGLVAAVPAIGIAGNLSRIGIREAHHVLPKFLGGIDPQRLAHLSPEAHSGFHQILRARLQARGIDLPIGGVTGSTAAWAAYFRANPGSQVSAFTAVLEASRLTDAAYGSSLVREFWLNIANGSFRSIP